MFCIKAWEILDVFSYDGDEDERPCYFMFVYTMKLERKAVIKQGFTCLTFSKVNNGILEIGNMKYIYQKSLYA